MWFLSRLVRCNFCVVIQQNVSAKRKGKSNMKKYWGSCREKRNHKRSRTHHKVPWPASLLTDWLPAGCCMPLFLRPQRDQATQWRRLISLMSWSRSNSPCAQAPCNGPHGTKVFRCSDAAMESRPCACQHRLGWKVGLGTWILASVVCGLLATLEEIGSGVFKY